MSNSLLLTGLLLLALVMGVAGLEGLTRGGLTDEEAVTEIEKLGGSVTRDERLPSRPVISINLSGTRVTDAELIYVGGLTQLKKLDLHGTQVTDAGLEHLKKLTQLQMLFLHQTEVTDVGVEHSKGWPNSSGCAFPKPKLPTRGWSISKA